MVSTWFEVGRLVSASLFAVYGVACLTTARMAEEFERYGMAEFRVLIGCSEVLLALLLLAGYFFPPLTVVGAGGLVVLMLGAVGTRAVIRDSVLVTLPALGLLLLNVLLLVGSLRQTFTMPPPATPAVLSTPLDSAGE